MQDSLVSSVHDIPSLVRMQRQFEHDSSFYHTFKKMYGITPAEFRRGRA